MAQFSLHPYGKPQSRQTWQLNLGRDEVTLTEPGGTLALSFPCREAEARR